MKSRADRTNGTYGADGIGRRIGLIVATIVVGSAWVWAWRQTERAEQAATKAEAARVQLLLAMSDRLDDSDRELLEILRADVRERERQAELARRGMLPELSGMGARR